MGKLLKCPLKGKICRKLANGQDIDYSEKKKGPRASSAPVLGLFSIIFKHVYWYIYQISGELLQDHWSSGFVTRQSIIFQTCLDGATASRVLTSNLEPAPSPSFNAGSLKLKECQTPVLLLAVCLLLYVPVNS